MAAFRDNPEDICSYWVLFSLAQLGHLAAAGQRFICEVGNRSSAVLPVGECRSSGLCRPRTPTARRAGPVLRDQPRRLPITTGTELWFIVSPMTFYLLSMATYMPIQFSSGRYPIR